MQIEKQITLPDGSARFLINVPKEKRIYVGYFMEAFEGMCFYTTPDKTKTDFEITVPHDYIKQFKEVWNFLVDWKL